MFDIRRGVLWLLVGLTLFSAPARGGDESEIRKLVERINDHLVRIKDGLYGIGDNVTSSPLDRLRDASGRARELRSDAQALASQRPSDDPARTMADKYLDIADRFMRSMDALTELKKAHVRQSEALLDRRCDEIERRLRDEARRYVDDNDPEGLQKLPELAEQLGAPIAAELEAADRLRSNISSWRSAARDFSDSHERWADVRDRIRDGAEATADRWERLVEEARRKCEELARRVQHREVQAALTRLGQSGGVREQLFRDIDDMLGRAAELLNRLHERSGESEVESAANLSDKLADTLNKLSYARGKDRRAQEVTSRWPGHVEKYRSATRALWQLKQYQFTLDRAPEKCKSYRDELNGVLARSDRGAGRDALTRAQQLGKDLQERLRNADNKRSDIERQRDDARRFSVDEGRWQAITRAIDDSAQRIHDYWKRALENAHRECDGLALGKDSPEMKNGMKADNETGAMSNCTVAEVKVLHDNKDIVCGQDRKCKGDNKDCSDLRGRRQRNVDCLQTRKDLDDHCFNGGNSGHVDQRQQVQNAIDKCDEYLAKLRCS